MRQIPISSSLITFLDDLEYTEAALRAEPLAAELALIFEEEIAAWSEVFRRQRATRRDVIRADALVAVLDASLDRVTVRFGGQALVEANQERKSAAFRRFFPVAPSEFVRGPLRKQCERTRDVIVRELDKLPGDSPLRAFSEPLLTSAKAALAALVARVKTQGEAATVATEILEWKEGVNRLRTTTHAELIKIATAQGLGRAWPEVFFRSADTARSEGDGDAPPAPVDPEPDPT
ncbi:MAG: hypothetical protein Q8S73_45820 [Deltaproteobacteria bacterium]|nr:hypothetical protein [Myxococcales bacterium]MDP3221490.1 hypothetical protein [Deltaproteobacteria bacterium]